MSQTKILGFLVSLSVCILSLPLCQTKAHAADGTKQLSFSFLEKSQVIDLTQLINSKIPSYDGKSNQFKYQTLSSIDKDGYASGEFYTHEHIGTHIDAPVHFDSHGKTIAELDPNNMVLPIVVVDVRKEAAQNPDYLLSLDKIHELEKSIHITNDSAILLLTGWDKYYFDGNKYRNADIKGVMHFPGFSNEAALYLVDHWQPRALGIDTLSIDYGKSEDFPVHKLILGHGLFMIENLANLNELPATGAIGIFAPLKIEGGTGSPARILALIPVTKDKQQ